MPSPKAPVWWVACSGGPDSMALLDWAVAQPGRPTINVAHVDHGWHPDSSSWADFVAAQGHQRGCAVRTLTLPDHIPKTEAAARQARYRLFSELLSDGDRLLVGHHLQDQRETVAMRLLRARPPRGMAVQRRLGLGSLWRPLLDQPKPDYQGPSIADPANLDLSYDRVRVRHWLHQCSTTELSRLDRLHQAWSSIEKAVQSTLPKTNPLPLNLVSASAVISAWLWAAFQLPAPPAARLRTLMQQLPAKPDRQPSIDWWVDGQRWHLRVYAGGLYLLPWQWSGVLPRGAKALSKRQRAQLHGARVPPWLRDFVWQNSDGTLCGLRPLIGSNSEISLEEYALNV